jgi:hypothetical protein
MQMRKFIVSSLVSALLVVFSCGDDKSTKSDNPADPEPECYEFYDEDGFTGIEENNLDQLNGFCVTHGYDYVESALFSQSLQRYFKIECCKAVE